MTTARIPTPEIVFFDVGDTLVRADPSWVDVYLRACDAFGLEVDRAELERALLEAARGGFWDDVGAFEASEAAAWDRIRDFDALVLDRLGHSDLPEAFFRELEGAFAAREAWHVFPDVLPALDALAAAGMRRAVISNWTWGAPELLHELDLAARFEALVISARVGYQKPNPGIFRHALGVAGVSPERAVHIGDSYRADVLGARSVGITPVLISRGLSDPARHTSTVPSDDPVPVVSDLFGLLELVGLQPPAAVRQA